MNLKIAFLSETSWHGKITSPQFENMRTEYAWYYALNADHFCISEYSKVKDYDVILVIWPKLPISINSTGQTLNSHSKANIPQFYPILKYLKDYNRAVCYVQEGPAWLSSEYEIANQIDIYNILTESSAVFCHNLSDLSWYSSINKNVYIIPTLIIPRSDLPREINPSNNKIILGGNCTHWYGGFQSYITALSALKYISNLEIHFPSMHCKRAAEEQLEYSKHLSYMNWFEWMKNLVNYKYAIHLMPTAAAGTFNLNCAYYGIPCIGNKDVDTQKICHPDLSINIKNLSLAKDLFKQLLTDSDFYSTCSKIAFDNYSKYYSIEVWQAKMYKNLKEILDSK